MKRTTFVLVLVTGWSGSSCGVGMQAASPEVEWAIKRSRLSTEFVKVRTPTGPLCVQRTEFPQWMTTSLIQSCWRNSCLPPWKILGIPKPSIYLPQQYEEDAFFVRPPEAATIGPFLPMHYLRFSAALNIANAASAWSGLETAYEVLYWFSVNLTRG